MGRQLRVALSHASIDEAPLWPDVDGFVRVITAECQGIDPVNFVRRNKPTMERWLDEHGACLLRGFSTPDAETFAATVAEFGPLLPYIERAAKRTEIVPGVFTSTELAPEVVIPQHHEMSYTSSWPRRVYFWCERPAESGGRTPLASERCVTAAIEPRLKAMLERRGLLYIRNFRDTGLDLSWPETYGTRDPAEVGRYANEAGFTISWGDDGGLRTVRRGPATVRDPITGESLWFNHLHLFHPTNLAAEIRASLVEQLGSDRLPRDVRFGDGEPVPDREVLAIRSVYQRHEVSFEWQPGDLLFLNNFLVTHGRHPFCGERRIRVAMTGLYRLDEPK